ncbi:GAF domain-containing protein [Amycolatopsis rhizosphaerae]|uniref:GAF domain-containing protein n=1 Tax=Amycolatopsis rhizosphaerae TaxID=2053003 RepID=A0A558BNP8_9PSEU|nr:GAF domain-containing protein [Amycolatopsis rhizosphaerae]TVT38138.1 GAF domain-containing protein [Amycolatopsis rhizosphaerae]
MEPRIDYEAVFLASPSPTAVLSPGFVFLAVNDAYLKVAGRSREELIGREVFEAFPDNPEDPQGARALRASLERVVATGQRHTMALVRYSVEVADRPGVIEHRYWSPLNAPVLGEDGSVRLILHRVEEVTGFLAELGRTAVPDRAELAAAQAEIYARNRELAQANERLSAAADIRTALLADLPAGEVLHLIATRAREIVGADSAVVLVPDAAGGSLVTATVSGAYAEVFGDLRLSLTDDPGSLSVRVFRTGRSVMSADSTEIARRLGLPPEVSVGAALAVPLGHAGQILGVLAVVRHPGHETIDSTAVHVLEPFAAQASIALELGRRRAEAEQLLLVEERERIATDLAADVINRLFGLGMELTAVLKIIQREAVARRVRHIVKELDDTIRQAQAAVMTIQPPEPQRRSLRLRIQELVDTAAESVGFGTTTRLDTHLDSALDEETADHLLAVLREAVSNVARHAGARQVAVTVDLRPDHLLARVEDDGTGIPEGAHGSGLADMTARAKRLGGTCTITPRPGGGTVLVWQIPYPGRPGPGFGQDTRA